jgi:hypothetical protein
LEASRTDQEEEDLRIVQEEDSLTERRTHEVLREALEVADRPHEAVEEPFPLLVLAAAEAGLLYEAVEERLPFRAAEAFLHQVVQAVLALPQQMHSDR